MSGIRDLVHGIRLIGGPNSWRAVAYPLHRSRADRRLAAFPRVPRRVPGRLLETTSAGPAVRFRFEHAGLELRMPRPGQLSVGWDGALDQPSWAVLATDQPLVVPQLTEDDDGWVLAIDQLTVRVTSDGALSVADSSGRVVRRDRPPTWDGDGWTLVTWLPGGATVHGLGGRSAVGSLRPGRYRCWNTDPGGLWGEGTDPLYVTSPVYAVLHDGGAVHCFMDNSFDATIDIADSVVAAFPAGPLRYHLTVGSLPAVLDGYTALTGRPALPPRWALGYQHAYWGWRTTAEVREVCDGFHQRGLPLAAVHVDIDHQERFRDFTVDPQRFADLPDLVADLEERGTRVVVIVDAGVARAPGYRVFDEGEQRGAWVRDAAGGSAEGLVWPGPAVFPDHTIGAVREWWGRQYAFYVDRGIAGYWHDMNEPSCFAAWGQPTLPLSSRYGFEGRGGDHREANNVYGLLMNRAGYEGLRRLQPDRRPFLFSRAGWAGHQRYGGHWTGDISTDWSAVKVSLHYTLGLGLSGVPYSGPDIGGFTGSPSPELYLRWFQLAVWLPFFRTHGAMVTAPRLPWSWPDEVRSAVEAALHLRSRMVPLWYSLARDAADSGAPYCRPLAWLDPALRAVDDAFLVGDSVLVAPVLGVGERRRDVRLPAGTWYDGRSGTAFAGGDTVEVPAPLGSVPWFVRAGAVLPTEVDGELVLLAAPPDDADAPGGTLWTDSGDGWEPGRRERYAVRGGADRFVVERQVLADGAFPWSGVRIEGLAGSWDPSPAG